MCRLLATLVFVLLACSAYAEITITNLRDREEIRHPIALLRGTASRDGVLRSENLDKKRPDNMHESTVAGGHFLHLLELVPGPNRIRLQTENDRKELILVYRPMTTRYRVNVIYVTAEDGSTLYPSPRPDDLQNYLNKLDTAAKLMQTFIAESMNDAGFGRKTFALEFDGRGKVMVHTLRYPARADVLREKGEQELYRLLDGWVGNRFPTLRSKNLVIMGFSGFDPNRTRPLAHASLGGGGMALYSNLSLFAWPDSIRDVERAFLDPTVVDDRKVFPNAHRRWYWQLASGPIGACLHELGHTWGLPHTRDPLCIMSRGFDHLNRAFITREVRDNRIIPLSARDPVTHINLYFALKLAHNRWFQPDALDYRDEGSPLVGHKDREGEQIIIEARHGVAALGAHSGSAEVVRSTSRPFRDQAPTRHIVDLRQIHQDLGPAEAIEIWAIDKQGNEIRFRDWDPDRTYEKTANWPWLAPKMNLDLHSLAPAQVNLVFASVPAVTNDNSGYLLVPGGLKEGASPYIDRPYKLRVLPAGLAGFPLLRTKCDHKLVVDGRFAIVLATAKPCYVFVALDERAFKTYALYGAPSWLREFADTGHRLTTDEPDMTATGDGYRVLVRRASAGRISLGPPCLLGTMYFAFFAEAK